MGYDGQIGEDADMFWTCNTIDYSNYPVFDLNIKG